MKTEYAIRRAHADAIVPDFSRNLHCLFGLPFDLVSVDETAEEILSAVRTGRRCVLSTPNLNFMVAAQGDPNFRASVIRSDLSVVDGMPLVWAGRWLGVPFRERVAGSSIFEHFQASRNGQTQLKVFLFGGGDGVAERAANEMNSKPGGVCCVGHLSPGFGSMESMSTPEIRNVINSSGADFVLVALGAKKGQAWIEHNLPHLRPPVVSYLGAVINFIAGTVRRAPEWMQRSGLEWAWRIWEENGLARRYWADGTQALGLMFTHVLPNLARYHLARWRHGGDQASIGVSTRDGDIVISMKGAWAGPSLPLLRPILSSYAGTANRVRFDMREVSFVGSSCVALMLVFRQHRFDSGCEWCFDNVSSPVRSIFQMYCAQDLISS